MAYRMFDFKGNEITQYDLQEKGSWCISGAEFEKVFIDKHRDLCLTINPDKDRNKYAPDLINTKDRSLADLKTQNTPFFLSKERYGINPQYAVSFNEKDYLRYTSLYPGIDIYFWVDWQAVKFVGQKVVAIQPMIGVWKLCYKSMVEACKNAPLHTYMQRINDQNGNAKDSYVLDISSRYFIRLV